MVVAAMSGAVEGDARAAVQPGAGGRLSSQYTIDPLRALLVPSLGGLVLGVAFLLLLRWRPAREIDPIEANALHGGRMSFRGSMIVALQTIWSSGVGASVGLEAGYTQLASGLAASMGRGVSSAPRRSAHHGRLRRRSRDCRRIRRAARRRLLCFRAGHRRINAGRPDADRRRRGSRLFRRPWVYGAVTRRRCRSGRRSTRA